MKDPKAPQRFNLARFFVENRTLSWVLLIAIAVWGACGYATMPKRKDPEIPVRVAVAVTPWPGADAEKVEQLVTKKVEEKIAENSKLDKIRSVSRPNVSIVYAELSESVSETGKEFDDIKLKLDGLRDLPEGAGPVQFIKDFGDTAALMLTVASPKADPAEVELRSARLKQMLQATREGAGEGRLSVVWLLPHQDAGSIGSRIAARLGRELVRRGLGSDCRQVVGDGVVGIDLRTGLAPERLLGELRIDLTASEMLTELDPDAWGPLAIGDLGQVADVVAANAGDKYTYRQLDDYTDRIAKALKALPIVSKATRSGVLPEAVKLYYSNDRLATLGLSPVGLAKAIAARNAATPAGEYTVEGRSVPLRTTAEYKSADDVAGTVVGASTTGNPVRLGEIVTVVRGYQSPATYLNDYSFRGADGRWTRSKAITLSVQMKSGQQIGQFGKMVDAALAKVKRQLPPDLILARTSDQPLQTNELISLFMVSLGEAIALVVLVSFVGFMDWRSAVMMGLAIPITMAITFGVMRAMGLDAQQVSIATLVIALGLLVDMPVVAADGIKRELAAGTPPGDAAWMGPVKLVKVLFYATLTNIAAYLPFLMVSGNIGRYISSLPTVMTISLLSALLVSVTFTPMLGRILFRKADANPRDATKSRFAAFYRRVVGWVIGHRWTTLGVGSVFLLLGGALFTGLTQEFFPKDLSYLSYVDVWLPEGAALASTDAAAREAEQVIRESADAYGRRNGKGDKPVLECLTTFVGGGGPRFWFSVEPELRQLNYAQIVMQTVDKHDTGPFVRFVQDELDRRVPGARIDVRQLETGKPVGIPVAVRISGDDANLLRGLADQVADVMRDSKLARRVRDDWGEPAAAVTLATDLDQAAVAGVSAQEIAASLGIGVSGVPTTEIREGDRQLPLVARLRPEERESLGSLTNLYVASMGGDQRAPLDLVATPSEALEPAKIRRRNQFRTVTISCFPAAGYRPSQVMRDIRGGLDRYQKALPTGYKMEVGGEEEEQVKGFDELSAVLAVSVVSIYLMLVFQLKSVVKPLVVFAAIPFGMVGALAALAAMGQPFGFMAFLGIASLVGVIVSHIIVLIEFIEERRMEGESLEAALAGAGVLRLRPVLITVGATVLGLVPLAAHGGPLWEPLCHAQIGGLLVATFVTLLLVPCIYALFVKDLKLIRWEAE